MEDLVMVLSVTGMFLIRIGIPVLLLVGLGTLIDRWQSKRQKDVEQQYRKPV
ncbi:MAG: hypothetical protein K8L99_27625 [Anaerolineae bacterium]|nr:hypothetical protein [Anaerolineae bacterium]